MVEVVDSNFQKNCKRCGEVFELMGARNFTNCPPCRAILTEEKKNRPKYNPETHRLCKTCKEVKAIEPDFMVRIEKKSTLCGVCRAIPKVKEEKVLDVNKLLTTVERNLSKILLDEEIDQVMSLVDQYLVEEEEGEE